MRGYRIWLAALGALAAVMLTASSASAQVSVTKEPGGLPCGTPLVSSHEASGGCEVHVVSTELVDLEVFGATVSRCNNEFEAQLGSTGSGWLTHQTLTGAECAVVPCAEAGGGVTPWPAQLAELGASLFLTVTFCVQGSQTTNCTVTVPAILNAHTGLSFSGESPELNCAGTGGLVQVHGNWTTEANPGVEISH
jgi:hypothetical protein